MNEIIYHDQCHHLYADDIEDESCLKRYFRVFDFKELKTKKIAVCNDYIRLKFHQLKFSSKPFSMYASTIYDEIVKGVLEKELHPLQINHHYFGDSNNLNHEVQYKICERPYLTNRMKLFDAITLLNKEGSRNSFLFIESDFIGYVTNAMSILLNHMINYMKYKSDLKKIKSILYQINKNWSDWYDDGMKSNDILLSMMELMIKYKLNK